MRILAGYYTHNRLRGKLLEKSLESFLKAAGKADVVPVVSSWEAIPNLPCKNVISNFKLGGHGHLNIILQLHQILFSTDFEWDYFAFCEHDCLYPETYFTDAVKILETGKYTGIASENHIGMRANGYSECGSRIQPLSGIILQREPMLLAMREKFQEVVTKGWCCIEPNDRKQWYIQRRDMTLNPIVHVNMDMTMNNHHLTNHFDSYRQTPFATDIPYWGDYKQYGIFSDDEVEQSTVPIITIGSVKIIDAVYGDVARGLTVSFMDNMRKLAKGKRVVANNDCAGKDPAPGVSKMVRVKLLENEKSVYRDFKEGEPVSFI